MTLVEKISSNFGADNREIWSEESILREIQDHIAQGRSVDERDECGRTALMMTNSRKVINELIKNGANVRATDYQGHSVILHAQVNGFTNLIDAVNKCNAAKQRG